MKRVAQKWCYAGLAAAIIFFDQITKWYAVQALVPDDVSTITSGLSFSLVYNRGVTWGLFASSQNVLFGIVTGFALLLTLALVGYAVWRWRNKLTIIGEVLVLAGSVGNLIDRFTHGAVVDFIALSYGDMTWPLFNVADVAIVVGVALMAYEYLLHE